MRQGTSSAFGDVSLPNLGSLMQRQPHPGAPLTATFVTATMRGHSGGLLRDGGVTMVRDNDGGQLRVGQFPRWAGIAAMLGGVLLAAASFLHNLQPVGCVGLDCGTGNLRTATTLVTLTGVAASLLILVGIAGMTLLARRSSQDRRLANIALLVAVTGFLVLFTVSVIQAVFYGGDFPGMPFFVVPGLLAVVAGFLMMGLFILRSGVFPRWLGIFLMVSTFFLLVANEQTPAVLLAIPFGLAMAAAGYFMVTGGARKAASPGNGVPMPQGPRE